MKFEPDCKNVIDAASNIRPRRLPLYEHIISPGFVEKVTGKKFAHLWNGNESDLSEYFRHYCGFFRDMTYDTVSFEVCLTEVLPEHGAILGGRPGPIRNHGDFEQFPWEQVISDYIKLADNKFEAMAKNMPPGMRAVGGVGNGVFEMSEDLVGYEYLCYMSADDPELVAKIYARIGDLMVAAWKWLLKKHGNQFCLCRFGDDLGFKTGMLLPRQAVLTHVIPQYARVISEIKSAGKLFLWHSCGNIFEIMDDVIALGIDAKHSNEDAIAPYEKWIELYSQRIGLFGGIDVDLLCREKPATAFEYIKEKGLKFRSLANGYCIGSGNSIPDYVPADGYLAMIRAAIAIREQEE